MTKIPLYNKTIEEITELLKKYNVVDYRAKQIFQWIEKGASSFDAMSNLPAELRKVLSENFIPATYSIEKLLTSSDKNTSKLLIKFNDGVLIETALMKTNYGNSVCVSSQAGCAMGCAFCASTLRGVTRNLTADEMMIQVKAACLLLGNERLSHIVIMGSGEPLVNFANVKEFLEQAHDPKGLNIGWRHITISTCGIVNGIDELTNWGAPINLAISLHAPNDTLRSKIMPINNKYPINDVIKSADRFVAKTNRKITYEYILLGGVNDKIEHAEELAKLLHGKLALVNLIPWNKVDERDFEEVSNNTVHKFKRILEQRGINATIRFERGGDINSACGQLRHSENKNS